MQEEVFMEVMLHSVNIYWAPTMCRILGYAGDGVNITQSLPSDTDSPVEATDK